MTRTITTMLLGLFLLSSCQDVPAPKLEESETMDVPVVEKEYTDRVMKEDVGRAVAALAASGEYVLHNSRAMLYSVDSLKAKDGSLIAFAVNFANDGGFILLSPTKKYYPVLAYSDKGHFDVDVSGTPVEVWTEDMSNVIDNIDVLPADTLAKYRRLWNSLLFESTIDKITSTKLSASRAEGEVSSEECQELVRIARDKRTEFERQGYKTYTLEEVYRYDDEETSRIIQEATGAIYPIYDHLVDALSFAVEINVSNNYTKSNLLQTQWNQTGTFNQSFPVLSNGKRAYAGCGPVALGQIMKYYRYPATYQWDRMHNNYGMKETSDLLYEIAIKAKASFNLDGTGTSLPNMQNAMVSYGYICERDVYSLTRTMAEINSNRPVCMTGEDGGKYHAWVASGFNTSDGTHYYEFYTMVHHYAMDMFYRSEVDYFSSKSLYVNWGWGGSYDGFYTETSNLGGTGNNKYTNNRKCLYVTKPQN